MNMDINVVIRHEKREDIETITEITTETFEHQPFSRQVEHLIIHDLRSAGALILSLVAEVDGRVVGHIAFSPVTISDGTPKWHGLGPMSVLPDFQGRRIGTALIKKGLSILKTNRSNGCALVGLPSYYKRFGFNHYPYLIHKGTPKEVFTAKSFCGRMPSGTVEFHDAFKQLSMIEKEAVADVIIDYEITGIKGNVSDPAFNSLIEKEILMEMPDGKFILRPQALEKYDPYFGKIAQFRAAEMSRVHKNPFMAAINK